MTNVTHHISAPVETTKSQSDRAERSPSTGFARPLGAATTLNPVARTVMQSRLGHDFSQVRIHTSGPASAAAQALQVPAFAYGSHIAFAPGAYNPDSKQGQRVLAHELAHVVQQSDGTAKNISTKDGSYQRLEQEAEQQEHPMSATEMKETKSLTEPVAPVWQFYRVPGSLACNEVVDWLNSSSPYSPEWAETACTYSFDGGVRTSSRTLPDGRVEVHARGHRGSTVSVDCPIDQPEWVPDDRPNRRAEVRAWRSMLTVLNAHERQHRSIGQTWRATLQRRFQAVDFTVTGSDNSDASDQASARIAELQSQWAADAQAAQDQIDPFRGAVLNCP